MLGVLLRIRTPSILISSDLEKAFLMLGLHEEDRDVCRFLWQPPGTVRPTCYRFLRVPFGVKTSPFLLNATIKHHLSKMTSPVAQGILRNIYVDNCFYGVDTVEEGLQFYEKSRSLFADAQMNLTQFVSNSPMLDRLIATKESRAPIQSSNEKLLGVSWNSHTDELSIAVTPPIALPPTKRRILQHIASNYDPIGIIAPVILKSKLFIQRLWSRSSNWDEPLTEQELEDWRKLEKGFCGPAIKINRKYFKTPTTPEHKLELHIFGDASDDAYGAVAYLRRLSTSSIETAFVTAKAKVSPLRKALSIPQSELLAIEKCAHLARTLKQEMDLPISSTFIWSDSMCSLDQLASNKASSVFARNRLREINRLAPDCQFSHISGKINPADVLSRGCTLEELRRHPIWWTGPPFLIEAKLPIRESSIQSAITSICIADNQPASEILNLDPTRFSSFDRMFKVVVRILGLFCKDESKLKNKARTVIIRLAQQLHPPDERTIENLHLVNSSGIWFYEGRIPEKRVPFLPAHQIAKLFVQAIHQRHRHSSPIYTLAKVRNEVWIPKGCSFVKKSINDCLFCKMMKSKPSRQPDFPRLPESRIKWSKPFSTCGMDYAGPLKVISNGETKKVWFIVFTCLTTRYTAIELVPSLSTDHLLGAIRRFTSLFGIPEEIVTDNAAQIRMLNEATKEAHQQLVISSINSIDLPRFKFIPALSPWSGGIYERMVGVIKKCLQKAGTTKRLLSEEDLRTLLKEAEAIINDRPLTTIDNSTNDFQPLRPVDFVFPTRRRAHLLKLEETIDTLPLPTAHAILLNNWMATSSLTSQFEQRWKEEYLQLLQERCAIQHKQNRLAEAVPPSKGDIVIFEDEGQAKETWPLAKVVEVKPRSAILISGRTNRRIERPFKKIYQLEIREAENLQETPVNQEARTENQKTDENRIPVAHRTRSRSMGNINTALLAMTIMFTLLPSTTASTASPNSNNIYNMEAIKSIFDVLKHSVDWMIFIIMAFAALIIASVAIQVICSCIQISQLATTIILVSMRTISQGILVTSRSIKHGTCHIRNSLLKLIKCCRRRSSFKRLPITVLLLTISAQLVQSCNDIAHVSANENACFEHLNMSMCHVNSVSIINVRANGSTSCLQVQHEDDQPLVTLQVEAEAIVTYCQKKTLFFSRDFSLKHEFVKRCDSAGSCSIETCSNIEPDEDLEELSHQAKTHPGYTGCAPGCGCWHCGCFYCDPACLFYRYFALPSSNDVYEIFQCPTWNPRLRINIQMGTFKMSTELVPGVKFKLPNTNVSITAIGLIAPPLQVHSDTFIAAYDTGSPVPAWISFTSTPPSAAGVPTSGLVGELQCSTRKEAENFKCIFDRYLCRCVGFATKVNCQCRNKKMSDFKSINKLPAKGNNYMVQAIKNQVSVVSTQETLVSLHIEMVNTTISRLTYVQKCRAHQIGELKGCHSCFSGGTASITCRAKKPTKGLLHCGIFEATIDCDPFGKTNEITMAVNDPELSLNCSLDCGHRSYIYISGALETLATFTANNTATYYSSAFETLVNGNFSVSGIMSDIVTSLLSSIWFTIFCIVGFVCVVIALRILRIFLGRYLWLSRRARRVNRTL